MNRLTHNMIVSIITFGMLIVTPTLQAQAPSGMVLIPGGEFEMGRHKGSGPSNELPLHDVYIDSFYMDIYEVTNQQYCDYLNAAYPDLIDVTGGVVYKKDDSEPYCDTTTITSTSRITWNGSIFGITAGKEDHPMLEVSWYGAAAYANWRSEQDGRTPCYDLDSWRCNCLPLIKVSVWLEEVQYEAGIEGNAGYRLPTEAEWEYAARGSLLTIEQIPYYKYPWGNDYDGSKANYWGSGDPYETGDYPWTTPVGYYDGNQTPAGSDMANGYGLYDMAGNVYEWCNDWYSSTYYSSSPYDNPHGPASGTYRVLRGGEWGDDVDRLRCAYRRWIIPEYRFDRYGFRLALAAE